MQLLMLHVLCSTLIFDDIPEFLLNLNLINNCTF
jgi:hypothetical protein